ncbi:hypothetical protein [Bacillus litorisediminis]|nr:hypothetical protein [Bacillus litorisediminis]
MKINKYPKLQEYEEILFAAMRKYEINANDSIMYRSGVLAILDTGDT